jgi:pyruvate dehydrogenase E2 component (dihydrolipoamide acetyltransferase)
MSDVVMPRLSDKMESGTILQWLVAPGARVTRGQRLVEIETDKATETFEAQDDGVLEIVAAVGDTLPVGAVIARIGTNGAAAPAPEPDAPRSTAKGAVTVVEPTRAQAAVARRMAEAKATIPEFTLTMEIDMERALDVRAQLAGAAGVTPTINDLVVRASALALREHPRANGAYRDGRFELYERVNVGVAVAAQDTLVVPTVFDADRLSLAEVAETTRRLVVRVRTGEITPPELSGGTFTVSNLGMYGVTSFTAVITPSQAATLAVGAVTEEAVMPVTLACDHRILYGADAALFLGRIRELLESPAALI